MLSFPRKLAEGTSFCNREAVRLKLANIINKAEHAVLVSPRRYGKTSLVLKVVDDLRSPFAHVDLFLALDAEMVIERFLQGIEQLIGRLMSINAKAVLVVKEFFKNFNVSLAVGPLSLGVKFDAPAKKKPEQVLFEAFEGLEAFLNKKRKKAVFFIDEMQDILGLPICDAVESTIRFFAQKSKYLSFIFSGSNRRLLQAMFDDKARPLWKLCQRIHLQRIDEKHYEKFINKAAKQKWKKELTRPALEEIFHLTECHPYYVNYLCSELWDGKVAPTREKVENTWQHICEEEASGVAEMLRGLSNNQKRILIYIAKQGVWFQPTSSQSVSDLKMTARGVLQALKGLLEKDFVEPILQEEKQGYRVVDPLLKQFFIDS